MSNVRHHRLVQVLVSGLLLGITPPGLAQDQAETASDADSEPYQLEKLVISAAKRREMAIRTIRYGLEQPQSTRPEDADKIVCKFRRKTGTHFWQLLCGSNSAWLHWSEENMSRVASNLDTGTRMIVDSAGRGRTPYNVKPGKFLKFDNVSRGKVQQWIRDVSGDDTDEENAQLLEKHLMARAIGFAKSQRGYAIDDIVKYALALREMRAAEEDFQSAYDTSTPRGEIKMAEARARLRRQIIEKHGLAIETFDGIAAEMRADPVLRDAIERAMQVVI